MINKPTVSLKSKLYISVLMAVISLLIAAGGYLFYKQQANALRQEKYNELKAIADLKESQIENWLHERNADAKVVAQSPFFNDGISLWLQDTANVQLKEDIIERLKPAQKELGYENIFLAKTNGELLLSANDNLVEFDTFITQKTIEASVKKEIVFTDFYLNQKENEIYYDIIAPIINNENKTIAVLIFRRAPNDFLYPLIQTWPIPGKSAETVILRVENDSVIFLNELRHLKNTALKLKIPLTRKDEPSVQAALGRTGLFEGIDYRGVKVLSDIRIIQGAGWIMFSKIDKSEIYADLNLTAGIITGFTMLLIIICSLGFVYIYNSRQKIIFKELFIKEKELWKQREQFEITLNNLGEGVMALDTNGNIQYMNNRAEELTGWKIKEARGKDFHDVYNVINEETGLEENNILDKVIKQGIVKELGNHTILISKSGKKIPVMDTGAPIFDSDGALTGIAITFQDETEKRHQQKLMKESEEKYKSLIHNSQDTILINYDNKFVYVNPAGLKLLAAENENQILGKTPFDFFHPDHHELIKSRIAKVKGNGTAAYIEEKIINLKGEVVDVEVAAIPYIYKDNKVLQVIIRDITERKKAEQEIIYQFQIQKILRQIASDFINLPLTEVDEAIKESLGKIGEFVKADRVYVFDYDWNNNVCNNTFEWCSPGVQSQIAELKGVPLDAIPRWVNTHKQGKTMHIPNVFALPENDTVRQILELQEIKSLITIPIMDRQECIGFLGFDSVREHHNYTETEEGILAVLAQMFVNISYRKLAEDEIKNLNASLEIKIEERTEQLSQAKTEADRANLAKSEFLSRMSHELRTPLNSILGFAQLLNRSETNPERKKRSNQIMNSGMHLLDLINEVLDLARIESGKLSLSLEPVKLSGIIMETLGIISPIAEEKKITLALVDSPVNNLFVKSDRQKLKQVMLNLINNAVKYNRKGGEVEVGITQTGNRIRISVRDTGIGIAPEELHKLFEPFQRIGAEISEVEGTGLGLAVAKKLVEAMNGIIGVESEPGVGSTFWIELPHTDGQLEYNLQTRQSAGPETAITPGSGTILYIEDNFSNIQLVEDILRTERPNVSLVAEMYGKNAVKMATDYQPGLILLDLDLPDIYGSKVLKLLQTEPATKSIPVVVLSADAMTKRINLLLAAGAKHYLTKPLEVEKFLEVVDEFLYKGT